MVWLRCSCGEGRDMISASPAAAPVLLSEMPEQPSVVPARFQPESADFMCGIITKARRRLRGGLYRDRQLLPLQWNHVGT